MSAKPAKPLILLSLLVILGTAAFLLTRPAGESPAAAAPGQRPDMQGAGSAAPASEIAATKSAARIEDATGLSTDESMPADTASGEPVIADCQEGCAHCATLLKLTESQAKYADEHFSEILETRRPDPAQAEKLKRACLQLAEAVMLEWSPEEDAPVLQAEATIRALEQEIVGPALAGVPSK